MPRRRSRIKVENLVAPLAIRDIGGGTRFLIFLVCLGILGASVAFSKRGSIAEGKAA